MEKTKSVALIITLIAMVILTSLVSVRIWGEKREEVVAPRNLSLRDQMTVAEFGKENGLPNEVLKRVFDLKANTDLGRKLADFNIAAAEIAERVQKAAALSEEYESKNWFKIPLKFALWFVFLGTVFMRLRRSAVSSGARKWLYLTAVLLFGVILGADPSPMGTVKDGIVLLGSKGVIFPPRVIALTVFLGIVLIANKFICSWGCQVGTLQDLIFRLNRNSREKAILFRQVKLPFVVTNSIRVSFFILISLAAFLWATDLIGIIDPFKIYKPAVIGAAGFIFLFGLLAASPFVYRPWCHLFCPFGFVGWLVEKASFFKIRVNYKTCIACESCAKACPSTVMGAILKQDRTIPDCFSCGTCVNVCPTHSVQFLSGKRERPPAGKFGPK